LVENKNRLPEKYHSLEPHEIESRTRNGIQDTERRAKSNPRCAVPQFFVDKNDKEGGELQLLLPINLDHKKVPDVAVVIKYDQTKKIYKIVTLLDLNTAYSNARLVQSIDQEWLMYKAAKKDEETIQVKSEVKQNIKTEKVNQVQDQGFKKVAKATNCRHFQRGYCERGDTCNFNHSK
jgi:hypothetical protein